MKYQVLKLLRQLKSNKLISNFFYLSILQLITLLVPLIATPHLVKVLNLKLFGLVSFSQSIMLLLGLLVDFGFNVSVTRNISVNRNSTEKISKIFSEVMLAKLFLTVVAFLILLVLLLFQKFSDWKALYLSSFVIIVGQAFQPTWVYQGLERMKSFALINVGGRVLYLVLLFVLVHQPADYLWVNLLLGSSFILTTVVSIIYLKFKFAISFVKSSRSNIIQHFIDSKHLFFTSLSISIYTYSNSAILGFFVGYEAVGLYSIAERIMMVLKQALSLFSQVLFPAGCRAAMESVAAYQKLLSKSYKPFLLLFLVICLLAFLFTPYIALYFYHTKNAQLENIIRLFITAVLITSFNIPAYQTLLSFNFHKSYSSTLIACCAVSLCSNIVLTSQFGISGTTANVLLTEVIVTTALYSTLHLWHKPYSILNRRSYV